MPFDLEIVGLVDGCEGGSRYLRWTELRALPTTKLRLTGEFVPGEQEVTVVFLDDLWARLPLGDGADTLLATCSDGYASIFTREHMRDLRPFLVLEIDGKGPEHWPPPGLKFNPGPYVISVSAKVAPAVAAFLDANHKRPWAVTRLEVAQFSEKLRDASAGRWAQLSARAQSGRTIWVNSCLSCHRGPGTTFGGTKSDRAFEVIAAYATHMPEHFKRYVRDPRSIAAAATMEAHPHYSDEQLDALIAFITAETASNP